MSVPLRVGIVVEHLTARGGTSRFALEWAHEARRRGHRVTVFTAALNRQRCYPHLLDGLEIVALREVAPSSPPSHRRTKGLRRAARFAGLHLLAGVPVLRRQTEALAALLSEHVHRLDVLNPHDFGPAMWASVEAGKRAGVPVVWQCNDPIAKWSDAPPGPVGEVERSLHAPARRLLSELERSRAREVAEILVLDHRVAQVVADRYERQPVVVRGALDASHFARERSNERRRELRTQLGVPAEAVLFTSVALIQWWRRLEDVIEAFGRLDDPRAHLYLAAPSNGSAYEATVKAAIDTCPAKARIHWRTTAFAHENELLELYEASDVFVFPNAQQTWGLAVLEAAAAGLPLVVSKGAGVSEVLENEVDALLLSPMDVDALTRALGRLIDDEGLRVRLAEQALRTARRFTWERYGDAVDAAFERALGRTPASLRDPFLPPDACFLPYSVPFEVPHFYERVDATARTLAPTPRPTPEWFSIFTDRVVEAIGQRYLPVGRFSDGEFRFLFGDTGHLSNQPIARRLASRARQGLQRWTKRTFTAGMAGRYHSGEFTAKEWASSRARFDELALHLAKHGLLALHLNHAAAPFQQRYYPAIASWLRGLGLTLDEANYVPFYFVYALLTGPARARVLSGRRVMVVNGATGDKRERIVAGLQREGAEVVHWAPLSEKRSMFDRLDLAAWRGQVDLVLVGAGIGKANVLPQLEVLGVPCLDAGFVFEVWADPSTASERPYCLPDDAPVDVRRRA